MWIEPERHEWRWVVLMVILTAIVSSLPLWIRHPARTLSEDAFLYGQPSRRGVIMGLLKKGTHVRVLGNYDGNSGSWIKIRNERDGNVGWMVTEGEGTD